MQTLRLLALSLSPKYTNISEKALSEAAHSKIDAMSEVERISKAYMGIYTNYIANFGYVPPEIMIVQAQSPIEIAAARLMAKRYRSESVFCNGRQKLNA